MSAIEYVKTFLSKCGRVWLILKKPNKEEYSQVSKVSAIGIVLLGAMGFLISLIMKMFFA